MQHAVNALTSTWARLLKLSTRNHLAQYDDQSVLIGYPTSTGSLGDEAMFRACLSELRFLGVTRIGVAVYDATKWAKGVGGFPGVNVHQYPVGRLTTLRFLSQMSRQYGRFGQIGADVLDGFYQLARSSYRLRMVRLLALSGVKSRIFGFSFRQDVHPDVIRAMKSLPSDVLLFARDRFSQIRIQKAAVRGAQLVADLAFLLQPDCGSEKVAKICAWVESRRAKGNIICGVNCNYQVIERPAPDFVPDLVGAYSTALVETLKQNPNVSYLMLPHDNRGEISDFVLAERIGKAIPPELASRVKVSLGRLSAAEVKAISGALDCVLTGRMHLAIACLGSGVPAASFEYQDKFSGLYEHFHLEESLLEPGREATDPVKVAKLLNSLLNGLPNHKEKVRVALPRVTALARENFAGFN